MGKVKRLVVLAFVLAGALAAQYMPVNINVTGGAGGPTVAGFGFALPMIPGQTNYLAMPFACTLTNWSLVSNVPGAATVDVWKVASGLPTAANSITAAATPAIVSGTNASGTMTGWTTTAVAAGDVVGFSVKSLALANTISFGAIPNRPVYASPVPLVAQATGGRVSGAPGSGYTITGPATISDNSLLLLTGAGTVTVTANFPANGTYAAATPVSQTFTVTASGVVVGTAANTMSFGQIPAHLPTDAPFTVTATSTSGLPIVYRVLYGPATVNSATGLVTLTSASGQVFIMASDWGNATFQATSMTQAFQVGPAVVYQAPYVSAVLGCTH